MKKAVVYVLVGLLLGAALMYILGPARFPNRIKPAEPTSFVPVTARLDSGGDLYAYFSTERFIRSMSGLITNIVKTVPSATDDKDAAIRSFAFNLIGKSGLTEVSGVGLSNVALAGGLQKTRLVVHHYPDQSKGLIWQLAPTAPRELAELNLLPADTALAVFNEFHLEKLWAWIKKEMEASGVADIQKFVPQIEPTLAAQGVELPKLLASLTGSAGYIVTLDKDRTIPLPGEEPTVTIPEPGLAVVIGVKDDSLFDLLKSKLPMAAFSEKDGRKILQFPSVPAPVPLEPCLTVGNGYFIAATTPRLAETIFQARLKSDGLVKTDIYKELSRNVPSRGNGFSFVSPRLSLLYANILGKVASTKTENPSDQTARNIFLSLFPRELKVYSVMENRADGIVWTSCHNMNPEMMLLGPLGAVGGLAAAAIIPNLAQVGDKAKQNSSLATLKTVGTALEAYMIDMGKSPQAESLAELQDVLVPSYLQKLPLKDAWGNDLLYKKTGNNGYMIASPGKDGQFEGWQQKGEYPQNEFNRDIILSGGRIVYGPAAAK